MPHQDRRPRPQSPSSLSIDAVGGGTVGGIVSAVDPVVIAAPVKMEDDGAATAIAATDDDDDDTPEGQKRLVVCATVLSEVVQHIVRGTRPPSRSSAASGRVRRRATAVTHRVPYEHLRRVRHGESRELSTLPNRQFAPAEVLGIGVKDSLLRVNGQSVSHMRFGAICDVIKSLPNLSSTRFARFSFEPEIRSEMYVINMADRFTSEETITPVRHHPSIAACSDEAIYEVAITSSHPTQARTMAARQDRPRASRRLWPDGPQELAALRTTTVR